MNKSLILFKMETIFSLDNTSDLIFFMFVVLNERKIILFRVDIWFSDYPIKIPCLFFSIQDMKDFYFYSSTGNFNVFDRHASDFFFFELFIYGSFRSFELDVNFAIHFIKYLYRKIHLRWQQYIIFYQRVIHAFCNKLSDIGEKSR